MKAEEEEKKQINKHATIQHTDSIGISIALRNVCCFSQFSRVSVLMLSTFFLFSLSHLKGHVLCFVCFSFSLSLPAYSLSLCHFQSEFKACV